MAIPVCHRYIIGLEQAEAQANRERLLGWHVGVLDPGVDPADYHWRLSGRDVLCYCSEDIDRSYLHRLVVTLLGAEARIVAVFDQRGNCLFGRFSPMPEPDESSDLQRSKLNESEWAA